MKNAFHAYLQLLLIIVLLAGNSCQRNTSDSPPNPPVDPLAEKVTASLQGRVVDENGKPVNNATVKSGSSSTATDINGVFRFNNIQLNKNAGFVLVEKTGYLKGSRTIFTNAGVVNNVEIQLIPKVIRGNFSATAGGDITIQNGSTVNFPVNGIINTATNAAYTGTVSVIGAYLDPTDPKLSSIMPGNLTGITTGNEQKTLQTFGMIAVELEGGSGEKLNLASGKTATISMPIPASLLASAPATIPLWFFDETKGVWIEEGSAIKTGSNYVGMVKHFSFWNCDVPANFITLKMKLLNQDSEPLKYHKVQIINMQNKSSAYGYTDSTGVVAGPVPSNANLNIVVFNLCGDSIHSQSAGPYNANTDLGNVSVGVPAATTVTITGSVVNCSNAAVTNGFAEIKIDGVFYRAAVDNNGNYSITFNRCSNAMSYAVINGTDLQAGQQGIDTAIITVTSGSYNAGILRACGISITQYINYNFNGVAISFLPLVDTLTAYKDGNNTTISGRWVALGRDHQSTYFSFVGNGSTGNHNLNYLYVHKQPNIDYVPNGTITANITEYGSTGQFIAGSFTGNVRDSVTNVISPVQCSFRVKRNF